MTENVILVDGKDKPVGIEEKTKAHKSGKLHRAFSVFVFNSRGESLLQKRAKEKYHSGGLWTNTCCGHPRPKEDVKKAALRRLEEEMGFICPIEKIFTFRYCAELDNKMTENEYDHVFFGNFNGNPKPNPSEAEGWKWMNVSGIKKDIARSRHRYTHWFKIAAERLDEMAKASQEKNKPR